MTDVEDRRQIAASERARIRANGAVAGGTLRLRSERAERNRLTHRASAHGEQDAIQHVPPRNFKRTELPTKFLMCDKHVASPR